jgi:hypothetical protein
VASCHRPRGLAPAADVTDRTLGCPDGRHPGFRRDGHAPRRHPGDSLSATTTPSAGKTTLGGVKLTKAQRRGDALEPHNTGSGGLVDKADMEWFVNTNITFSTTSSASAAFSEASFQKAVTASTLNGGTVQSQLNDAYDGYNAIYTSLNGTLCTQPLQTGCTGYNKLAAAPTAACNNRALNFPVQSVDGLNLTRQVYVPSDDHFERTLNTYTNPGTTPITATMSVANNLGSDDNTKITGTSNGSLTAANGDSWVTTFQNWSGTTTSDPRLGHVLGSPGAVVSAQNVSFANGNDRPSWSYTFTVQPGQSVIIGQFGVADGTIAESKADSARLSALPSTATECMTSAQVGEMANFVAPVVPPAPPTGYWLATANGGVYSYNAQFHGALTSSDITPNKPVVGLAPTPDSGGYWLAAADGGVFAYGNAQFHGSAGALHLNQPVVGIAPSHDGAGYWLVAADGGVFTYGDAPFKGSLGGMTINKPVVGMAASADGLGYWLVAADGGVFSEGDAVFHGSAGNLQLNKPIVGMAVTPDGGGYWLVASDGGVFAYGNAQYYGSLGGTTINQPIVGIAASPTGKGYRLVGADGGVFDFGDAQFQGSAASQTLPAPVTGIANG